MSTITASLINLTNSTPQNGHLSTQPKNPARCPLDPLAQQAKSVLIPITKRGISTLFIYQKYWHTGVYRLFICALKDSNTLDMGRLRELINRLNRLRHLITNCRQALQIAHQGGRIARHIDDLLRAHHPGGFN